MLKVYGQLFTQSAEGMEALVEVLESAGYEVAFVNQQNATIIKNEEENADD